MSVAASQLISERGEGFGWGARAQAWSNGGGMGDGEVTGP